MRKLRKIVSLTIFCVTCELILAKTTICPIFRNFRRNRSFCWTPFYLLYHLNLVILAKTAISAIFFQVLEKLQKWQFLQGTLVPPLTPVVINFSKNCDFSNFSQFLEKLQFLLDTLLPPVPLDFINFSKNCDFSNFFAIFEEIEVFAGHP